MSINFLHSCNFVWMELLLNQRPLPYNDKEEAIAIFVSPLGTLLKLIFQFLKPISFLSGVCDRFWKDK